MKNLKEYIKAANHSSEKWFLKNYPEVYDEIITYSKDINNVTFKQKLWHYQYQIPNLITCANNECTNLVNFKGRWTEGYYKFCCQKCSVTEVEQKKSLLNYSRQSILSKEEKQTILQNKITDKLIRKQKSLEKKKQLEDKKTFYNTITMDNYLELINNSNGLYIRESFVKENMPHIYDLIDNFATLEASYEEKVYMYCTSLLERPKCKCEAELIFKNKTIGYGIYCSTNCSGLYGNQKGLNTLFLTKGVKHHSQLPHNIDKKIQYKINKVKDHIKNSELFIKYNSTNKEFKLKCDKCTKIHTTSEGVIFQRMYLDLDWRDCITGINGTSNGELKLREYIESIYSGPLKYNDKSILNRKEIDIYIPDLKIGIEYNGLYYHNEFSKDMNYHHNKWKLANDKEITLIQIYEDEWNHKKDIVKSRLKNLINSSNTKIYARKCTIKQVQFGEVKEFLNTNHLQGSINSSINYGLYYNDELVSLMTFGKPRKGIKYKTDNAYELYRFCSKLNHTIIGSANRLFNYFIKTNLDINEVYSFSALEWPGKVYEKLGMQLKSISKYSYWYIEKGLRFSRHKYNKQNLIKLGYDPNKSANEILKELKIYRIFGPGNKTFVWNRS